MCTAYEKLPSRVFLTLILPFCFGCPVQDPMPAGDDGNVGVPPGSIPNQRTSGEPNDTFEQALDAIFDDSGAARLTGVISSSNDVDVYSLGPIEVGDRLVIDVSTPGRLDATIALFDADGRITHENDDRNLSLNQLDPFLNVVARRSSSNYFLAISAAPLGNDSNLVGAYNITIQLARGGQPPPTAGQILVLDFDGGTIDIPGDKAYTVGPFNTANIDPVYAGRTAVVRQQIVSTVLENFDGLQLDVRVTPGNPLPPEGAYSRVLVGGTNPTAFGISQAIDPYNENHGDDSIVFTDMFTPGRFGRVLTSAELGIAIGNVATHEVGHLLGLNHVANVMDLMDTVGGPSTLLLDQEFITSPLDDSIFFIGLQDSWLLLTETLGLAG